MLDIFRQTDIYGIQAHLTVNHSPKYYPYSGGILTFISIILDFIFILFRKDYFNWTSRKDSVITVNRLFKKIKFDEEKIWVPWKIGDYG